MASSRPEISIVPATATDLPALVDLQFLCFSHSVIVEQIVNPDTPQNRASMLDKHVRQLQDDPGMRIIKAVVRPDPQTEILAGYCIFNVPVRSPTNPDELVLPPQLRPPMPDQPSLAGAEIVADEVPDTRTETDIDARGRPNGYYGVLPSQTNLPSRLDHRQMVLKKYMSPTRGAGFVRYMCVHPSYRGYGAGKKMMEWGCRWFDECDVDAYLEATEEGTGLYQKFGFEKVDDQELEVDGKIVAVYPCMWRKRRGESEKGI